MAVEECDKSVACQSSSAPLSWESAPTHSVTHYPCHDHTVWPARAVNHPAWSAMCDQCTGNEGLILPLAHLRLVLNPSQVNLFVARVTHDQVAHTHLACYCFLRATMWKLSGECYHLVHCFELIRPILVAFTT